MTILQSEAAECSLACLAMVAQAHGLHLELAALRQRFPVGLKGATLEQLMQRADALGFVCRPLRLALEELPQLECPCILHWDLNHFVVLRRMRGAVAVVDDPAVGRRQLRLDEVSRHFTGVALELVTSPSFAPKPAAPPLKLTQLTGKLIGLRRALLHIALVALALELFALTAPLFQQLVVDDVLNSGDRDLLTVLALGFGLLMVIQSLLGLARTWMLMVLEQRVALHWSARLFTHLLRLPPQFFEQRQFGDVVSRFGSLHDIRRTLTSRAMGAVLDGVMSIAALMLMLVYAPVLCAISVTAVALYALLRVAAYAPLREAAAERLVVAAREQSHFLESLRAIVPLKLFGREPERGAQWQHLVVAVQNRDVRTARLQMGFETAHALLMGAEHLLVFWIGARLVLGPGVSLGAVGGVGAVSVATAPALTVGMLLAFISYKTQFVGRVSALIDFAIEWRMLRLHAQRLADIAWTPTEREAEASSSGNDDGMGSGSGSGSAHLGGNGIACLTGADLRGVQPASETRDASPATETRGAWPASETCGAWPASETCGAWPASETCGAWPASENATLTLHQVSFRYSEDQPWLLRDVDLALIPGERLAITGPSGAGKTTLLKVMLGLLSPTEGEVRYAGRPVRRLGWPTVRRQLAAVMQDDVLITGSIADNISFFDPSPDLEHVVDCARKACIHMDILAMPMGYQTLVGELGHGLSGGQKQRLLLARALYKRPQILLLDEATSHLDHDHESAVAQALGALALTQVVIAHRPATIATAHRVLHLHGGHLTSLQGPHQKPRERPTP